MKIYLASSNENKKREMQQIFAEHEIVTPKDMGITFDPQETGTDFYQNSLIKARALWDIVHAPVIADDSGITVCALGAVPGVWSARYAGPEFPKGRPDGVKVSQEEQNEMLIRQLNDTIASKNLPEGYYPYGERSAYYSCSMVFMINPSRFFVAQETMEGTLLEDIKDARGQYGFGYDPIFFLPDYGKTGAELLPEEKNAVSHRGKACRAIIRALEGVKF